jgi:Virulence-associated protein E
MAVVQFRPYRVRRVVSGFGIDFTASRKNREFAEADLAKSGLTVDDIYGYAVDNLVLPDGAQAGYLIPYYTVHGKIIEEDNYALMYRLRLKYPEFSRSTRYTQPSGEELLGYGLPSFVPYLYPCEEYPSDTIYCCEGEKKTVSLIKHLRVAAFGISGCNLWGNPARTGGPHPWILDYLSKRAVKRVIIIPDGDVFRYDICTAYGTFAHALKQAGYEVELLNPPGKIDDLIVQWGDRGAERLRAIPKLATDDLVQSPAQLATTYNLAFKRTKDDKVIVHQHTSNIMKLLRDHPAFPKIWLDQDRNRVMLGNDPAQPEKTEMDIANHIQHNFGLEKVSDHIILRCMRSLSKENARSPMMEYIKGITWDGVERLNTWLSTCWGVEDNGFTREVGSKWLVSACARMHAPGSKVDWMFIVIGPQGTGKTSMPGILFRGNNATLYGEHNDKDLHLLLHSSLVVGFDELDSFSRKDASLLKAMITTTHDIFRPPYAAAVDTFPRRFTLYGCGNRSEFLQSDPSGQRRYAIVEVPRLLDFKMLEDMRDQLWAEAWQVYQQGKTKWWEVENASEEAKKHEIPSILGERLQGWIESQLFAKQSPNSQSNELKFTMSEILAGIGESMSVNSAVVREAAGILKGMGLEQRVVRVGAATKRVYILAR